MKRAFGTVVGAGLGVLALMIGAQLVDDLVDEVARRRRRALEVDEQDPDAGA